MAANSSTTGEKTSKELLYSEYVTKPPVELIVNNTSKSPDMKFTYSAALKRAMEFLPKMKEADEELQKAPEECNIETCDENASLSEAIDIYVYSNRSDDGNEGDDESSGDEPYMKLKKKSKKEDLLKKNSGGRMYLERMKATHSKMIQEMK